MPQPITQLTAFARSAKDDSEIRVVAKSYAAPWQALQESINVDVFRLDSNIGRWVLLSDRPHPDAKTMSVDDYIARGRSEVLQHVSPGAILSAIKWIGRIFVPVNSTHHSSKESRRFKISGK